MDIERTSYASGQAISRVAPGMVPPYRILVADDDGGVRLAIARELRESGYHVESAEDGAVAWDMLQVNDYDLLLTDHDMPNVSGIDLVKKLRSAQKALSVILMSGLMPTAELERHPWLRLAATLEKPFAGNELTATVDNALHATRDGRPSRCWHPLEDCRPQVFGYPSPPAQRDPTSAASGIHPIAPAAPAGIR